MVPDIKKILFTTDLSPESRQALDYAISLATQYGASLTIIYVMEESQWSTGDFIKNVLGEERWQQLRESQEQEAKQILIGKKKEGALIREALNEFCETAQEDHRECEFVMDDIVVARGVVVDEIIYESEQRNCDLMVMGYHVRGPFGEALLGSTTRRVLRRSKIPVFLVRLKKKMP
ncbi:MAG: universal stress protein [Desulfobacterales bacterium]|jgi:nucleotide-binding universal stress UspA family protein